jgi:hypothetical protein
MAQRVDPGREPGPVPPDPDHVAAAARIGVALSELGFVLPGSIRVRYTRCGRSGCRCMADPPRPHGPYWWWTRKVNAKTVTRILTDEQYAEYRPWFDNARRARQLLAELEALSVEVVDADPRSTRRRVRRSGAAANPPVDEPRSQRR